MMAQSAGRRCDAATATLAAICIAVICGSQGCSKPPPDVVAVGGVVLIDGSPLASAAVRFFPTAPGLPGTWIASGVTGPDGRFTLEMPGRPGVAVGTHRVTVDEAPVPEDVRESQGQVAKYLAGLKLRPIPKRYSTVSQTPLTIEVGPDTSHVELSLTR